MNMNMLINMFTKLIARKAMNWGINKGVNSFARKGDQTDQTTGQKQRPNQQTQDVAKRLKNLNRMTRR